MSTERHNEDERQSDATFIDPALRVAAACDRLLCLSSSTYPSGYDFVVDPYIRPQGARNAATTGRRSGPNHVEVIEGLQSVEEPVRDEIERNRLWRGTRPEMTETMAGASPMTSREPRWIERRAARGVRTKLCQLRDTRMTNDKAMRRLSIQPFGLRRLVAVCCVSPPRRILLDTTSSSILASGHKALATRPRQVVGAAPITLKSSRVKNEARVDCSRSQ